MACGLDILLWGIYNQYTQSLESVQKPLAHHADVMQERKSDQTMNATSPYYNFESNSSNSLMCLTGCGPALTCSFDLNSRTSVMMYGVVPLPSVFTGTTSPSSVECFPLFKPRTCMPFPTTAVTVEESPFVLGVCAFRWTASFERAGDVG